MSLSAGGRIGSYQVLEPLGAGGMGEVYRARDTRLGRDVTIKVRSPTLAADLDRRARLEREARLLASLNHPNIATLHGIEDSPAGCARVMELIDGETLADRLALRPSEAAVRRRAVRMLTGVSSFARPTTAETFARVLRESS